MPKRHSQLTGDPDAACAELTTDTEVRTELLQRIAAEMAACEAMGDVALARHTGRKLLAALACAADALLFDDAKTLHAAPDKVGAFFDKAAAGLVQAIDGMQRAALMEAAAVLEADEIAPARPRPADPLAGAIAAWGKPEQQTA